MSVSPERSSTVTFRRAAADLRPRALERFARKLQFEIAGGRPFECLISGDAELRRLNRQFRGKDYPTDVLSFPAVPLGPLFPDGDGLLGDIAISASRARIYARRFGHSTEAEVRVLMLHGVLHLLGMDHETDHGQMAGAEKQWRARLGLPNGLIERAGS